MLNQIPAYASTNRLCLEKDAVFFHNAVRKNRLFCKCPGRVENLLSSEVPRICVLPQAADGRNFSLKVMLCCFTTRLASATFSTSTWRWSCSRPNSPVRISSLGPCVRIAEGPTPSVKLDAWKVPSS